MSSPEPEDHMDADRPDEAQFPLSIPEVCSIYSVLYANKLTSPPLEELKDRARQKEMMAFGRPIAAGFDYTVAMLDHLVDDMREHLLEVVGEALLQDLEASIVKHLRQHGSRPLNL